MPPYYLANGNSVGVFWDGEHGFSSGELVLFCGMAVGSKGYSRRVK